MPYRPGYAIIVALFTVGGCVHSQEPHASMRNAALARCGTEATLSTGAHAGGAVDALIDGDVANDSRLSVRALPASIVLTFAHPVEAHRVRLYPGHCDCADNPSGECGIRAFSIEGWVNGDWKPLGETVRGVPDFHAAKADGPEGYFIDHLIDPELINQLRVTVLETNDTGRRISSPDKPIVPRPERVCHIREIQVFEPGEPVKKRATLPDLLQGDFRLPAFRNVAVADLHLFPQEAVRAPLALILRFGGRDGGQAPAPPLPVLVQPQGKAPEQIVPIDISTWPDGEYVVSITAADGTELEGELERMIRKKDLRAPVPPPGPVDVRGRTMLFMDSWYTETESAGLTRRVNRAQTHVVLPRSPAPSKPFMKAGGLTHGDDGSLSLTILTGEGHHQVNGPRYRATSKNGRDWTVREEGK